MEVIADFHVHSRYAMACSSSITLAGLGAAADSKGISVISTGDFTHPLWMKEIKERLEESGSGSGLYRIKGSKTSARFVLGAEISTVFSEGKKFRKIHNCVVIDSIEAAEQINDILGKHADLSSDGRPTVRMSAAELVGIVDGVSRNALIFPAHAWTPYFGVLGAVSGFDSVSEAYADKADRIYALETGLSSDPGMNWMVSDLDRYCLLSNSAAHSLQKIGREANVFSIEKERVSYAEIVGAIR